MIQPIKKYLNDGLDSDSAEHLVAPSRFISGRNFRTWSTDIGQVGYIENILKNAEKEHTLPSGGTNIRIGFASDDENGYIVKFNQNSNGDDGIYLYDIVGDVWYTVLMSSDVTGGLNFNKYYLINGAFIINGILYWNDGYNEPRKLNLGAFMSAYHSSQPVTTNYIMTLPVDESEITLIRKPCALPPTISKSNDSGFVNNYIANESFQFAIEYIYFDGEFSVLSAYSKSSLLNLADETYNYIRVVIEPIEIPQTVRIVRLIVKDGLTNKGNVIKSWDRLVASENTDINNSALEVNFYNNIRGEAIPDVNMVKPFDSVPTLVGTMEPGKNRNILADITEGYDTPSDTSLTASLVSFAVDPTEIVLPLLRVGHRRAGISGDSSINGYAYIGYYVFISGGSIPSGYYLINGTESSTITASSLPAYPAFGAAPTTVALSGITFKGTTTSAVISNTLPSGAGVWNGSPIQSFFTNNGTNLTVTGATITTYRAFNSNVQYNLGVVFYDYARRKCGVVFNGTEVVVPQRNFAYTTAYGSVEWALSNTDAVNEIPDWAHYYAVVMTLNLRTRSFISAYDNAVRYATYNTTTQLLEFTATTFSTSTVAIGINRKALLQANLGYVAQDGDQCVLIDNSDNSYEIPVIGEEGEYILLKPVDVGDTTSKTWVYQVYTPYKTSDQEPFYEMGEIIPIDNPGEVTREYNQLTGNIRADAIIISRNYNAVTYLAEAMSPNDTYFQRWDTDAGMVNLVTKLGQVRKRTGLRFSNVYIQGTLTNGLSSFEALNSYTLPEDMGTAIKLVLTSKVQKEGSVLLAIGEQETASIYLGETEVFDAEGNSFLAKSDNFIGQVNILRGGYGTSNHESVIPHDGNVSFFSKLRGCFVTYSNSGLFPISNNGLMRVAKLFASKYASLSVSEIEVLGSRPFVFGGYDPYHKELYFSIPSTESTPPKGYLEDYVSPDLPVIYPYDIYDGVGKVLVYKVDKDAWGAPHSYETEGFVAIRDLLFSAKNGALYKHNVNDGTANTFNSWYGVNSSTAIGFIINEQPNIVKEFLTLSIEGNTIEPDWVHHRTELPFVQSTDNTEWTNREGVLYEKYGILRDRLSPNVTGSFDDKLYTGDNMRGQWLKVFVEYDTRQQLQVRFFNVGFRISDGQTT